MDDLDVISFSTVFQLYHDNGQMIMKSSFTVEKISPCTFVSPQVDGTSSQDYMGCFTSLISLVVASRMHVKTDASKAGTKT